MKLRQTRYTLVFRPACSPVLQTRGHWQSTFSSCKSAIALTPIGRRTGTGGKPPESGKHLCPEICRMYQTAVPNTEQREIFTLPLDSSSSPCVGICILQSLTMNAAVGKGSKVDLDLAIACVNEGMRIRSQGIPLPRKRFPWSRRPNPIAYPMFSGGPAPLAPQTLHDKLSWDYIRPADHQVYLISFIAEEDLGVSPTWHWECRHTPPLMPIRTLSPLRSTTSLGPIARAH